jgi:hypothetical protein
MLMIPPLRTTTAEGRTQSTLMIKQGVKWDTRLLQGPDPMRLVFGATGAGLVLASNRLLPFNRERLVQNRSFYIADDWRQLLDSIRIDQRQSQVNFIAVPDDQLPESLPEFPAVAVRDMQIRNQDVSLTLQTSDECFLRLALSYYPELRVRLDNRDVRFHETKDHFIYLRCPAGTHRVAVSARMTLLRQMMFVVSGVGLVFVAVTLIAPRKRRRRQAHA